MTTTSTLPPETGRKHPRVVRGIRLWQERASDITEVSPGVFRVPSLGSEGATYTVRLSLGSGYCSCPDRAACCKHRYACEIAAVKDRCRRRRTARRSATDRRHGPAGRAGRNTDGRASGPPSGGTVGSLRGVVCDPARLDRTAERLGV